MFDLLNPNCKGVQGGQQCRTCSRRRDRADVLWFVDSPLVRGLCINYAEPTEPTRCPNTGELFGE